ncbi:MAG: carbon starvation protein A [Sulfolobales archaeon]
MLSLLILIVVLAIYGVAYYFYGKRLLEQKVVKADPNRLTPAVEKFDGIDYVPANKYVLYGHHFASIAGSGPIVGPATAMVYGWAMPLVWVLFGNVFIGAVHDYLSIMASVRHGGLSIMTVSENVMGRKARYIAVIYVWMALVLVLAAFFSVAASTFVAVPQTGLIMFLYMPIALFFGMLVYKYGVNIKLATVISLVFVVIAFWLSFYIPVYLTYEAWVLVLAGYSFIAAALPVWYLLQPRDYMNAYLLWSFVAFALIGTLLVAGLPFTGPSYTDFAQPASILGAMGDLGRMRVAYFWPVIPLIIACGALSGFHSLVGSGTTSKQLSNELDATLVGYGGMLTEGAISSLAVITPIAFAWDFAQLGAVVNYPVVDMLSKIGIKVPTIVGLAAADRFYTGYALLQAAGWSRVFGLGSFEATFIGFRVFAATALTAFIITTLDTANRLARFAWQELFGWVKVSPGAKKVLTNRWVASLVGVIIGVAMAYPQIYIPELNRYLPAYSVIWPAFSGTNQLLAALMLMTASLWVYAVLKVRGGVTLLTLIPALFLWVTVTLALFVWIFYVMPSLPSLYIALAGSFIVIAQILNFLLLIFFIQGIKKSK